MCGRECVSGLGGGWRREGEGGGELTSLRKLADGRVVVDNGSGRAEQEGLGVGGVGVGWWARVCVFVVVVRGCCCRDWSVWCVIWGGWGGRFEFHSLFYGGPQPMEAAL